MLLGLIWCSSMAAADGLVWYRLACEASLPVSHTLLGIVHGVLCVAFACGYARCLPHAYRRCLWHVGLLTITITLFVPVLGMAGLLLGLLLALHRAPVPVHIAAFGGARELPLTIRRSARSGRQEGDADNKQGDDGRRCIAGTLAHASDTSQRARALVKTVMLADRDAVSLLRIALRDPEDDIRLLAYSLLGQREKTIELRIRAQEGSADPSGTTCRALAHEYWEMAHLDARGGAMLRSFCAKAREQAQRALLTFPQDGGLHLLNGRILLLENHLEPASAAFGRAQACGVDLRMLAPYRAEIAYLRRDFSEVAEWMRQARAQGGGARLHRLRQYWTQRE